MGDLRKLEDGEAGMDRVLNKEQWYLFYSQEINKSQQAVGQLTQIPWGHNIAIISKCKNLDEAIFYIEKTIQNNWLRSVLTHHII